jgi:DNA adenine methylase
MAKTEKLSSGITREEIIPPNPFVKWAGGKSQLLSMYSSFIPETFHAYHEPFVGGGALFFNLYNKGCIKKAYLNDSNSELINLYLCIRDNIEELFEELGKHEANKFSKQYYYKVRNLDRDPESFAQFTSVQRAARALYLNKTCFNGLFRVNRKGQFNVPFGNYKNPNVLDEVNLRAVRRALKNAAITCLDFQQALLVAHSGDLIYFDPPYYPVSATSSFTSYTENSFSFKDQERLAQTFRELDEKGCYVMLSNSYIEPIIELYKGYRIETLMARRAINCQGDRRGPVPEIVVTNY